MTDRLPAAEVGDGGLRGKGNYGAVESVYGNMRREEGRGETGW